MNENNSDDIHDIDEDEEEKEKENKNAGAFRHHIAHSIFHSTENTRGIRNDGKTIKLAKSNTHTLAQNGNDDSDWMPAKMAKRDLRNRVKIAKESARNCRKRATRHTKIRRPKRQANDEIEAKVVGTCFEFRDAKRTFSLFFFQWKLCSCDCACGRCVLVCSKWQIHACVALVPASRTMCHEWNRVLLAYD